MVEQKSKGIPIPCGFLPTFALEADVGIGETCRYYKRRVIVRFGKNED